MGGETNSVAWQSEALENLAHFGDAEDDGQLLFGHRPHDAKDGPATVERVLVEKADAADGDGHGVAGVMLDVLEIEKILAQFFLAEQVG